MSIDSAQPRKALLHSMLKPKVTESRAMFERADSAGAGSQKSAMMRGLADQFKTTFTSGFTASQNKAWLRENYRQLRIKIEDLTREANAKMDRVKERYTEVKQQEGNRRS
mmetsp:Transcript_23429/g.29136  ORF Transcript_23429/g.29136 Transcript_23429/m.29136 type:complete len:110 (-) Transcript_23429:1791-2120(-)